MQAKPCGNLEIHQSCRYQPAIVGSTVSALWLLKWPHDPHDLTWTCKPWSTQCFFIFASPIFLHCGPLQYMYIDSIYI